LGLEGVITGAGAKPVLFVEEVRGSFAGLSSSAAVDDVRSLGVLANSVKSMLQQYVYQLPVKFKQKCSMIAIDEF